MPLSTSVFLLQFAVYPGLNRIALIHIFDRSYFVLRYLSALQKLYYIFKYLQTKTQIGDNGEMINFNVKFQYLKQKIFSLSLSNSWFSSSSTSSATIVPIIQCPLFMHVSTKPSMLLKTDEVPRPFFRTHWNERHLIIPSFNELLLFQISGSNR